MDPNKHSNNSAKMAQLQHLLKQRQEHHYNMSSMFASQQDGVPRSHLLPNYPPIRNNNLATPIRKERKKYAPNACTNCRNLHLSCAVVRPCPRCVASGKSDCCVTVYKKRGRPAKSSQIAAAAAAGLKASKEGEDKNQNGNTSSAEAGFSAMATPTQTKTDSRGNGSETTPVEETTTAVPPSISNSAQILPSTFTPEKTAPSPSASNFNGKNQEQPLPPSTSPFVHFPSPLKKRQYIRKFRVEKRVMHPIAKHPKFVPYRHPPPLLPRFPSSYHLPSLIHYPCTTVIDMYRPCGAVGEGMASTCPSVLRKVDFYGHPMGSLETLLEAIEVREKQDKPVNDAQLSASASTLNSGASSLTLTSCSSSPFMPMLCGPECEKREHFTSNAAESFNANLHENRMKRSSSTFTTAFQNPLPLPNPKSNMYNKTTTPNPPIFNPGPRIPQDADMCIDVDAKNRRQEPLSSVVLPTQFNFTAGTGPVKSPKSLLQPVPVPVHVSEKKSLAAENVNIRTEKGNEMEIVDTDLKTTNSVKGGEHADVTGSIDQQVKHLRLSAPARVQDD